MKKCLRGQTQNVNEAFNQIIWRRVPKDTFVGKKTLDVATASAAIYFNDGAQGILTVLEECRIVPGHYAVIGSLAANQARVAGMNRKSTDKCKSVRKYISGQRKVFTDKDNEKPETYSAGGI